MPKLTDDSRERIALWVKRDEGAGSVGQFMNKMSAVTGVFCYSGFIS